MAVIEAEFQDGILRPKRPLRLRSGEQVSLVVVRCPDPARWNIQRLESLNGSEEEELAEEGLDDWQAALEREDRR